MSIKPLTGYDNREVGSINEGARKNEIFLYDAGAGTMVCASCNVDGSRPTADATLPPPADGAYQQRYLDDAGQLFFSTADPVSPEDTNGLSDVYVYEHGGPRLLSPSTAGDEAVFADASDNGSDVFFTTRQRLVGSDGDSIVDLYDARVGGGVASQNEPPPVQCLAEGCKPPASEQLVSVLPGSSSFAGPENPVATFHQKKSEKSTPRHKKRRGKPRGRHKKAKKRSGKKSNAGRSVKRGVGGAK
jgi:hypothetical protein